MRFRLMRRTLVAIGLAAVVSVVSGMGLATASAVFGTPCHTLSPSAETPRVALVLAGGVGLRGWLTPETRQRVVAAAALIESGYVDRLIVTGGVATADRAAPSVLMAQHAVALGVEPTRIVVETASRSTLENGLFSKPLLTEGEPVLLVTSGFHLWRSQASMAWAGLPVALSCSSNVQTGLARIPDFGTMYREGPKWPVNVFRAGVWSIARVLGADAALPDWWLA